MKNTTPRIFFLSTFLLGWTALFAQDYFGDDLAFFQKKTLLYQHWLDDKGLGAVLKVDEVKLQKNDQELELWLTVRNSDPDSAAAIWQGLETNFAKANADRTIGHALYYTFIRFMEIPPRQGNVQIYIPKRDGYGYDPCFYIWLWEENGQLAEEKRTNNCKAQAFEVVVRSPVVRKVNLETDANIRSEGDAREIFEKVISYARKRYERTRENCEGRNPRVEEVEMSDYSLSFSVSDLCQEVLRDEKRSAWCRLVERWWGPCNDMRRERLEFELDFIPTNGGFVLKARLTGKFGSGVYRPRKSGYMDMEPDFEEDFLHPYVIEFRNALKMELERK